MLAHLVMCIFLQQYRNKARSFLLAFLLIPPLSLCRGDNQKPILTDTERTQYLQHFRHLDIFALRLLESTDRMNSLLATLSEQHRSMTPVAQEQTHLAIEEIDKAIMADYIKQADEFKAILKKNIVFAGAVENKEISDALAVKGFLDWSTQNKIIVAAIKKFAVILLKVDKDYMRMFEDHGQPVPSELKTKLMSSLLHLVSER